MCEYCVEIIRNGELVDNSAVSFDDEDKVIRFSETTFINAHPWEEEEKEEFYVTHNGEYDEELTKIANIAIDDRLMLNLASYMDDEIREELHSELAPCTNYLFMREYLKKDPDFYDLLKCEFEEIYKKM